jgi:hypothetical protein
MNNADTATLISVIWTTYIFDRIEVTGRRGAGEWEAGEPVSLSIPGRWLGEFESGPNLNALAAHVARILGPGWYGLKSVRKLGLWDQDQRLRALYDADCERRRIAA